jgi:hypothetical protein
VMSMAVGALAVLVKATTSGTPVVAPALPAPAD